MRIRAFVAAELSVALASAIIGWGAAAPAAAQSTADAADTHAPVQKDAQTRAQDSAQLVAQNTSGAEPANGGSAENAANAQSSDQALQEVVVTGLRRSIQEATTAKRNAIGVTDSIFAEDIGKFADTNIAESFQRVPGINIVRDVTGQGVNISIRGLGTDFTKVLLNGAPIAIASTGITDAQNVNREVDLNMFPTELFTQLTVKKTSSPDMLEGGASGTVNMRSARPFDDPGAHITGGAQAINRQNAGPWGERGYIIASNTWDNGFGVLIGGVGVHDNVATPGFETIGWTNPNLTAAQCAPAGGSNPTCNQEPGPNGLANAGGNWTIPATVPAGAGAGLVPGTPIDNAFLLANNPGLSIQQIDNALLPRLGRPSYEAGPMDRDNAVLSFEYRPTENLHFFWDSMYGREHNELVREDMDWVVRNGAVIPLNEQVDQSDCSKGCVVKQGTYANAQFFLEYRPYTEDTRFWGTNPGFSWKISDLFNLDVQGNYTKSSFHREVPSVLFATPSGDNVVVDYVNGSVPQIASNVDLNDPANFVWNGSSRVNIQDERRETETKGARFNFKVGREGPLNFQFGAAYDDILRHIFAFDNSQAWQNAVCGDNPNVFVPSPNSQPPCEGLSTPTPVSPFGGKYPTYPGLGTGYSAGLTPPVVYQGSLVPVGAISSYARPGPAGFITLNWPAFAAATNYDAFHNAEPLAGSSNTGASGGYIDEKTTGVYGEITGDTTVLGNELRYVAGVRWVHTNQTIGGYVSIPNPLNAALLDGGKYPNVLNFVTIPHSYDNTLPSFEVAYNLLPNAILRLAASRTMTRPDPSAMLPGLNFSQPSADTGTVGNSALQPFISDNFDVGIEYYTGQEGYVAFTAFRKRVTGFTTTGNTTMPFSSLAVYGVTYDTLTPTQQNAINSRGGPGAAQVTLQEQINASGALTINGYEIDWTQPLDFLIGRFGLNGFGWQANYTLVDQFGSGAAPAIATGVPPHTWNVIGYYDHGPVSVRLATVFNAGSPASGLGQNGIAAAGLYTTGYHEWDISTIIDIGKWLGWRTAFQLTIDGTNLFDEKQRTYFQFPDATFTQYNPGRTWMLGFRAHF
ncbi:MAG TPA: TonB-dependent receptor [Steroidobacteraceae bacterium]|nr:TonB-dependent receptor [Steroidobacteraceae bacterium]